MIIGAGGVGRVVAHKCAALREVFTDICLASHTQSKAQQIASEVKGEIEIAQLDADRVSDTVALIRSFNADLVIHVALPYQDLAIMDACLEAGVDYLDTANYEPLIELVSNIDGNGIISSDFSLQVSWPFWVQGLIPV